MSHTRRIYEPTINSVLLTPQTPFWEYMFSNKDMSNPITLTVSSSTGQEDTITLTMVNGNDKKQSILSLVGYSPATYSVFDISQIHLLEVARTGTDGRDVAYLLLDAKNIRLYAKDSPVNALYYSADHRRVRAEDNENFTSVSLKNRLPQVIEAIQALDPDITHLELLDRGQTEIWASKSGLKLPVTQLGDGISRILSVLLGIYSHESGYVLIDEIDRRRAALQHAEKRMECVLQRVCNGQHTALCDDPQQGVY